MSSHVALGPASHAPLPTRVPSPTWSYPEPLAWAVEWALLLAGLAALVFLTGTGIWGDAELRYQNLVALLEQHTLTPPNPEGAGYSIVGPLFSAPLYFLGKALHDERVWTSRYNLVLFFSALAFIVWRFRSALGGRTARRFALLLVLGSMFPFHVLTYYTEVFSALLAGVGLWWVAGERRWLGFALLVLSAVNTPGALVPLGVLCAYIAWKERRLGPFLVPLAAGGLFILESWLRRGGPFHTYYLDHVTPRTLMPFSDRPGFSYPLPVGLMAVLFSFGKGLVFFTPGAFVAPLDRVRELPERAKRFVRYAAAFSIALVVVYCQWWAWSGDWFWGPRFYLFLCLPASLFLALRLREPTGQPGADALTVAVTWLSCWVAVNGVVFRTQDAELGLCLHENGVYGAFCHFTMEYSVLWRPFISHAPLDWSHHLQLALAAITALWLTAPFVVAPLRWALTSIKATLATHRPGVWRF